VEVKKNKKISGGGWFAYGKKGGGEEAGTAVVGLGTNQKNNVRVNLGRWLKMRNRGEGWKKDMKQESGRRQKSKTALGLSEG